MPSENPNLAERGLIITDFVDRVGDPVAIVASDGSSHRAEALVADAVRSLLQALTGTRQPAGAVGIAHPAHWRPAAVEVLRGTLQPALVVSDATAALTALHDDPGLPAQGIIALCDVGGTGVGITLVDAAGGLEPIGPTVRHTDFSGDLIDQALLRRVLADLATAGAVDLSGTSAIGSLSRLRGQCKAAKERLSTSAVTSLTVELPGHRSEVRITRTELDAAVREPLDGLLDALSDTLARNGIRPNDLVAVATVGGGARVPILTTTLSEHLRVPVVTSAQPELAAAIGAGLRAVRALNPDGATAMAPVAAVAPPPAPVDPVVPGSSTFRALAWSDAEDIPEPALADPDDGGDPFGYEPYEPRPQLAFTDRDEDDDDVAAAQPWYRRPVALLAVGAIALVVVLGAAALYVLRNDDEVPVSTPTPTQTPPAPPPTSEVVAPSQEPPPPAQEPERTVIEQAPPPVVTVTEEAPPVTETAPPPTETPPPPTTTEPPPPPPTTVTETEPPPSTQPPIIPTLPYRTIPGLPFVPAPIQPPQP